jgi:hypothetical protein
MKRSNVLCNAVLPLTIVVVAFGALANEQPKFYAATNQSIQEVHNGAENASAESKRVQREFIGKWVYHHDIGKANVSFRWNTLTIDRNGTLVMEYQGGGSNRVEVIRGRYEFIHKGTPTRLPGKRPVVLVTPEGADFGGVIPLVSLTVDYDARVALDKGMVLKFCDLDRNEFVFLKSQ